MRAWKATGEISRVPFEAPVIRFSNDRFGQMLMGTRGLVDKP